MNTNTLSVLTEVADERARQDAKWGPIQNIPLGCGPDAAAFDAEGQLGMYRYINDEGNATFLSVLAEEFFEFVTTDARDTAAVREELIQIAAVAVKAVEHIDRRAK